jgi:hypothetical protein
MQNFMGSKIFQIFKKKKEDGQLGDPFEETD